MSIKFVSPVVVAEVLKEQGRERVDGSSKEDGAKGAVQRDQFVRLSVNLQRTMGLFNFSAGAVSANPILVASGCDKDCDDIGGCDVNCDCVCDDVNCDTVGCDGVCDDINPCDDIRP